VVNIVGFGGVIGGSVRCLFACIWCEELEMCIIPSLLRNPVSLSGRVLGEMFFHTRQGLFCRLTTPTHTKTFLLVLIVSYYLVWASWFLVPYFVVGFRWERCPRSWSGGGVRA